MYLDFYGFREKPFNLTPDPRFVFLSKQHRDAFAHLLYGLENRVGFMALTGEVGSGKTTVLRAFLSQLDAEHYRTALIFNPCLSPSKLLQSINREFGLSTYPSNRSSLLDGLNQFLLQQNAEGRMVVLVIDEAQNLEAQVLEQVRLLSNMETDKEKLIHIVLSGQPEFMEILRRRELRQLNQRITVRYHLQPLDFQDTVEYVYHRAEVAGGRGRAIFSEGALKRIYGYSGGLPRLINAACDRALLAGYTREAERISFRIAAAGIKDLKKNTALPAPKRRLALGSAGLILAAVLAAGFYYLSRDLPTPLNPSPAFEAKEEQAKKYPIPAREELFPALAAELGRVSESESARRAFNTLAGIWKARPVPENARWDSGDGMERAALERQLYVYPFSGNLGALLRIDYPAVLELALPGIPGKRSVSLVGVDNQQLLVEPPIAGRRSLSPSELEKHWTGQGFLLWRDPLNLLTKIWPGAKGAAIQRLQGLLREAGAQSAPLTGVYDENTLSAVKEFQSAKGIDQDGIVGSQTLMVLYRSIDRFQTPKLTASPK